MKNKVLVLLVLAILATSPLLALGAREESLFFLPRNIVNNSNVPIEMSQTITPSIPAAEFSAAFDPSQASIFRIVSTMKNINDNYTVTIKPTGVLGWYFVHESNSTIKRPFELALFGYALPLKNWSISEGPVYSESNIIDTTNLFSLNSNNEYTITIPGTSFTSGRVLIFDYNFADMIRYFDVGLYLPEYLGYLEPGNYSCSFDVTANITTSSGKQFSISETIVINGYYGITPEITPGVNASFIVNSGTDTFNMQLDDTNKPYYHVANLLFSYSSLETTTSSLISSTTYSKKFKVYISPTPDHTQSGTYQFIKTGTENAERLPVNTVYYNIYPSNTGTSWSGTPNSTGGLGVLNSVNTTKVVYPQYTYREIQESAIFGSSNDYQLDWSLNFPIYLQVTDTENHGSGIYFSYLYFILEAN